MLQACNPPDIFWPIARWLRRRDGSRFVFDHHDLCPELYDSRFPDGRRCRGGDCSALEKATFRTADHVVSTNASYAEIAMRRGGKASRRRDGGAYRPRRGAPAAEGSPSPHCGAVGSTLSRTSASWAPRTASTWRSGQQRTWSTTSVATTSPSRSWAGATATTNSWRCATSSDLQDHVELPGRVPDETVLDVLSTAAVGLSPDPKNPLNDVSTMNKTLEYMAFGLPVVAFDLKETRVSAGEAASYVESGDVAGYARAIVELLDDADKRESMGKAGRLRIERGLGWPYQRDGYVGVFDSSPAESECEADMCGVAGAFLQSDGAGW